MKKYIKRFLSYIYKIIEDPNYEKLDLPVKNSFKNFLRVNPIFIVKIFNNLTNVAKKPLNIFFHII
jgi:hypothetical protein